MTAKKTLRDGSLMFYLKVVMVNTSHHDETQIIVIKHFSKHGEHQKCKA